MIDEIIAAVKADEKQRAEEIAQKKKHERDTIDAFIASKQVWSEKEKERAKEEERRASQFIIAKEAWQREQVTFEFIFIIICVAATLNEMKYCSQSSIASNLY